MIILGVEETTGSKEVWAAAARECKIKEKDVVITSSKMGRYGAITVRVEMSRRGATNLIKDRRLQVGWVSCSVKDHVRVLRCFNSLEFGHRTHECKAETSRKDVGINCRVKTHKVKECTENQVHKMQHGRTTGQTR